MQIRMVWGVALTGTQPLAETLKTHKTHKFRAKPVTARLPGCAQKNKTHKNTQNRAAAYSPVCVFCVFLCIDTQPERRAIAGFLAFPVCFVCFRVFEDKKGARGPCLASSSNQTSRIVFLLVIPVSIIAIPAADSLSMVTAICLVLRPLNTDFDLKLFFACSKSLPFGNFSR